MTTNIIDRAMLRSNLALLFSGIALIVMLIIGITYSLDYYRAFFNGALPTTASRDAYLGLAVMGALVLLTLVTLALAIERFIDPTRHPIMKALAHYGDSKAVAEHINHELNTQSKRVHTLKLTRHWIVLNYIAGLKAVAYRDVVWVYPHVTQHHTYGIPLYKSFACYICDQHGTILNVPGSKKQVAEMLEVVYDRVPWAVTGYSRDLEKTYNRQRGEFAAAVDQRKAQLKAARQSA